MIEGLLFAGGSARGRRVRLAIDQRQLKASADDGNEVARWPLAAVQWPERTRHVRRVLHLADGGSIEFDDAAAFDAWRRSAGGPAESWVVRSQQHWRATLTALLLLIVVLAAGYRWGVPWAARGLVAVVPLAVDEAVGQAAYDSLRSNWLEPSQLPPERRAALRAAFTAAVAASSSASEPAALARATGSAAPDEATGGRSPAWRLEFHRGGRVLGANAFALPGGTIVITDQLVELLEGHDDTVIGVLGHELGHVKRRHGMHALAQFTLISTATSVALGDFSSVLAGVPALLAQMGYSRDAEREADSDAAELLLASGRSPEAMVLLFERLQQRSGGGAAGLPIAFASHPADADRIAFFRSAAEDRAAKPRR